MPRRTIIRHLPTATFLRQMGVASVVAGIVLVGLSHLRKFLR